MKKNCYPESIFGYAPHLHDSQVAVAIFATRAGILARDPVCWMSLLNEYRKDVVSLTGDIRPRTGLSTIFVIEREDRIGVAAVSWAVKRFRVAHVTIVETEILGWRERDRFADRVRRQSTRRQTAPLK